MQQTPIVVQTVLSQKDVPIGTALILFAQTFGGALSVSIAQNVFTNELVKNLRAALPGQDPHFILAVGATELRKRFKGAALDLVVNGYNAALTRAFFVSVATAALSIFGAVVVEWRNVKKENPDAEKVVGQHEGTVENGNGVVEKEAEAESEAETSNGSAVHETGNGSSAGNGSTVHQPAAVAEKKKV